MRTHRIGAAVVDRICEIECHRAHAPTWFGGCTFRRHCSGREWLDERFLARGCDDIFMSFQSYLLRVGGLTVLVDACNGNDKDRPGTPLAHRLRTDFLGDLARAGVRPEDVDIVLCTHLHFDHVGWNTRLVNGRWVPTFPNARYLISRKDYEWFESGEAGETLGCAMDDSVLPVMAAGQVQLVDDNHVIAREIDDGLWIEGAPGHTPGSVMLHCKDKGGHAVFAGDAILHPLQAQALDMHIRGEVDWALARQTRIRLLEACAEDDRLLFAAHFRSPVAARVKRHGSAFRIAFPE
jgi:glyoxylase-like metal-dependent hydrolase (beta-lactamase superfamily II)